MYSADAPRQSQNWMLPLMYTTLRYMWIVQEGCIRDGAFTAVEAKMANALHACPKILSPLCWK